MDFKQTIKMVEELEEMSVLEGTELGELWAILCHLPGYSDYFISEDFEKNLLNEIELQLKNIKENAKIVINEETIKHTSRSLEWI